MWVISKPTSKAAIQAAAVWCLLLGLSELYSQRRPGIPPGSREFKAVAPPGKPEEKLQQQSADQTLVPGPGVILGHRCRSQRSKKSSAEKNMTPFCSTLQTESFYRLAAGRREMPTRHMMSTTIDWSSRNAIGRWAYYNAYLNCSFACWHVLACISSPAVPVSTFRVREKKLDLRVRFGRLRSCWPPQSSVASMVPTWIPSRRAVTGASSSPTWAQTSSLLWKRTGRPTMLLPRWTFCVRYWNSWKLHTSCRLSTRM